MAAALIGGTMTLNIRLAKLEELSKLLGNEYYLLVRCRSSLIGISSVAITIDFTRTS